MKTLLTLFVLFFSSSVFADNISDFEIEGMSIGNSLLDYFSEEEIINASYNYYKYITPKKFYQINLYKHNNFRMYDGVLVSLLLSDNDYIIYSLDGYIYLKDNENCNQKIQSISLEMAKVFNKAKKVVQEVRSHPEDPSGKSTSWGNAFFLGSKEGNASVRCYLWSDKMPYDDNFRVSIRTAEYNKWLY